MESTRFAATRAEPLPCAARTICPQNASAVKPGSWEASNDNIHAVSPTLARCRAATGFTPRSCDSEKSGIVNRRVSARSIIEPVVYHPQDIAQVFLTAFPSRQIGKIGRKAGSVGRMIVFIETKPMDTECRILNHCCSASLFPP